jgi:hypothetical protein
MIARRIGVGLLISLLCAVGVLSVAAKAYPFIEKEDADWGDTSAPLTAFSTDTSVIYAGHLNQYNDVDALVFSFDAPDPAWEVDLAVAACGQHFAAVYPTLALIGVDVAATDAELPFEVAEAMGVQLINADVQTDAKRATTHADRFMGAHSYVTTSYEVNIPAAGDYMLAVYEPRGHTGAYMLTTGSNQDQLPKLPAAEIDAGFEAFLSGEWVRQDCATPLAAESCPVTDGRQETAPNPPERSHVGEGFVLTGIVRDSSTCLPVANAEIIFWMANENGDYEPELEGKIYTNQQGAYWIESIRPGSYGPPAHIHMAVSAPGGEPIVTEFILTNEVGDTATFDITLEVAK